MKEKRPAVLMFILLVLLAGYFLKPYVEAYFNPAHYQTNVPPLAGANEIKNIKITREASGEYSATVDYFYRGDGRFAGVTLLAVNGSEDVMPGLVSTGELERGNHTIKISLQHPMSSQGEIVTRQIFARMRIDGRDLAATRIDYVIEWPDMATYFKKIQLEKTTSADLYNAAVISIDQGSDDDLNDAKKNLETLLLRDPKYVLAYPELARIAMKSNWGPEGLKQAENFLKTGLQIDPNNANVKVLMGYVYVHQKRFSEAAEMFEGADKSGTKNLWLWANWGEMFDIQGKGNLAKEKYLIAINRPRGYDTYDRAMLMAYQNIFKILENEKKFDELNTLYYKRAEEFEKYSCFYADYGMFRLTHFGDYAEAVTSSKKAIDKGCGTDDARYVLGMAYYTAWHKLNGEEKAAALAQASIFLPPGPKMLYQLARYDETSKAIPELVKSGVSTLNSEDNEKYNALAYAVYADDTEAAQRLAKSGARFEDFVSQQKFPIGLVAFQKESVKMIKVMKSNGVNFSTLRYRGMSASDYAHKIGNKEIIDIVDSSAKYHL